MRCKQTNWICWLGVQTFADDLLRRREMRQMSEQLGPRLSGQEAAAVGQSLDDLQNYAALRDLMAQGNAR